MQSQAAHRVCGASAPHSEEITVVGLCAAKLRILLAQPSFVKPFFFYAPSKGFYKNHLFLCYKEAYHTPSGAFYPFKIFDFNKALSMRLQKAHKALILWYKEAYHTLCGNKQSILYAEPGFAYSCFLFAWLRLYIISDYIEPSPIILDLIQLFSYAQLSCAYCLRSLPLYAENSKA